MPHQIHDRTRRHTGNLEVRAEGMPQGVEIDMAAQLVHVGDAAGLEVFLHRVGLGNAPTKHLAGRARLLRAEVSQRLGQSRSQRERRGLFVLRGRGPRLDERLGNVEVQIGPKQRDHFPATQAGIGRDVVNQPPPTVGGNQPREFVIGQRPPLAPLLPSRLNLGDSLERMMRHVPLAAQPRQEGGNMPEVFVERFRGKDDALRGTPLQEPVSGNIAQQFPAALLAKPRDAVAGKGDVLGRTFQRGQIRQVIDQMHRDGLKRGLAERLGREQSRRLFRQLAHDLAKFRLGHMAVRSVQGNVAGLEIAEKFEAPAIDAAAFLFENAWSCHGGSV